MAKVLQTGEVLSGLEGMATVIVDGNQEDMFYLKECEITFEKEKVDIEAIGRRMKGKKTIGGEITGSASLNYTTPTFRRMITEYVKTGKDVYFTLMLTNDDINSTIGKQTLACYGCNLDGVVLGKLNSGELLEEDIDFTIDSFEFLDELDISNR